MNTPSEFTQSFFDASSKAWKKNKVKYGQAMYAYKKDAFQDDPDMPILKVSRASLLKLQKEYDRRRMTDVEAPYPQRKSPRLREKHVQETYSSQSCPGNV